MESSRDLSGWRARGRQVWVRDREPRVYHLPALVALRPFVRRFSVRGGVGYDLLVVRVRVAVVRSGLQKAESAHPHRNEADRVRSLVAGVLLPAVVLAVPVRLLRRLLLPLPIARPTYVVER